MSIKIAKSLLANLLPLASLALLLIVPCGEVSAGAQIDVGVGDNRFFVGEQFIITFKDVIYWMAGMCMGLIFASTFLFINDFSGVMGMVQNKKADKRGQAKGDMATTRDARLIGSKKYPTDVEERILTAIHTEPENYVTSESRNNRQGRLIGSQKLPTGMENSFLERVDAQPDNSFVAAIEQEEENSEPTVVSRLFNILFSLPISETTESKSETSTLDINHFF